MIIQLCWEAEPTSRPIADTVCNKLSIISSIHLPAIPLNPLLGRSPSIQRNCGQSVFLDNINPISRPDSPPISRSPPRRAATRVLPRFRLKALPMVERYRTSLTLENQGSITSIVQSSDGKVLVAGLLEGSCIMWNPDAARKIPQDIQRAFDPVSAIAFELSTSTYVTGFKSGHVIYHHHKSHSDSTLTLTGNDKPILCLHVLNIVVMALSINPRNQDLTIIKWCLSLRAGTSDVVERLLLQGIVPSSCLCAAFSSDGKEIYIGTSGGSLFIYSTNSGQIVYRPFYLSSRSDGAVLSRRGPSPNRDSAVADCRSLAISPDGKRIMVSYSSGEIRLWDIKAGSYSVLRDADASGHSYINSPAYSSLPVTFSPDGSYVAYASATDPGTVDIQDVFSKKVLSCIDLDGSPMDGIRSLSISPNNKRLIVGFHNSSRIMVCVWD